MIDTSKIYTSKNYGKFKIVKYKTARNVLIEFVNTGFKVNVQARNIKSGAVKDLLMPKVYGVGFLGVGEHQPSINGKREAVYTRWMSMLARCYTSEKPSYKNSYVCDEWHNFQNFAEWFKENNIEGFEIDKDELQYGVENKVYSPKTCIFVHPDKNKEIAKALHYKVRSPKGAIFSVYNMSKFCKEHGLARSCMCELTQGKVSQHKGWTNE